MTRLMLGLLVVLTGCTRTIDGGIEKSETRTLDSYDRVKVERGLSVSWSEGEPSAVIDSQQEVMKVLRTFVRNGQLTVTIDPGVKISSLQWTTIALTGHGLRAVELHDSSAATLTGISEGTFLIEAHDASSVEATGAVDRLQIRATDASAVRTLGLAAKTVDVLMSDASSAEVQAVESIGGVLEDGSSLVVSGTTTFDAVVRRDGSTVKTTDR